MRTSRTKRAASDGIALPADKRSVLLLGPGCGLECEAPPAEPVIENQEENAELLGYDAQPHIKVQVGQAFCHGRYVVQSRIGNGSHGTVVRAWDKIAESFVAIKFSRRGKDFTKEAYLEASLLCTLNAIDDQNCCVRLLDGFEAPDGHYALVFEMLSFSLYDLICNTAFQGMSLDLVRRFARQSLKALSFLAKHQVVHCDIKPENILLRHPRRSAIKFIDFGSSCKVNLARWTYIQSRFYRSPEVILGCKYGCPIDMWSLACVLVELHTGSPLFPGTSEKHQMELFVHHRGMLPSELLQAGKRSTRFFERLEGGLWAPLGPNAAIPAKSADAHLRRVLGMDSDTGPYLRRAGSEGHSLQVYCSFVDLIDRMLAFDPGSRITPDEALAHEFVAAASDC